MNKCDINCEHCWCKVFYAKSGVITAYCAKAKRQIQNVSKHVCNMQRSLFGDVEQQKEV